MIDIDAYLDRISYQESIQNDFETLTALQRHHLLNVPFENLDIHWGNQIQLEVDHLFDKIIKQNRGGFCYELNGLFGALLDTLGFKTRYISARVYSEDNQNYSPEFDHLAIIVTLDDTEWLVDVGFGEFTFGPLKLHYDAAHEDERGTYRIIEASGAFPCIVQRQAPKGSWKPEYRFNPKAQNIANFEKRCHFHQTSDESHFRQKKICSLPTESGRYTLTDRNLKITDGEMTREQPVNSESEFEQLLRTYFGIHTPD